MRRSIVVALAMVASSRASIARADDVDRSVELGRAGLELYTKEDWTGCAAKFAEASRLAQSPVFLLYQGRCLRNGRELLRARDALGKVAAFELPADAPPSWRQSKTDGQVELRTLETSIPSIVVEIAGATASEVRLDGNPIAPGRPLEVDPGSHRLSAIAGDRAAELKFEIETGVKDKKVTLTFGEKSDLGVPPIRDPQSEGGASEGSFVPGAIVTGIGGGALIVGTILGGVAATQFGDIESRCGGDPESPATCQLSRSEVADLQSDLDDTNLVADTATGLLIGGGVVTVVGVVLLIVAPGGAATADARGLKLSF